MDCREIRKQSTQPPLVDEKHVAAQSFFGDSVLRLAFRSDEKNCFALGCQFGHELCCFFEQAERLLEIDDVDAVALTENVSFHFRIPALGLVSEVDASLQKFLHCNRRQINLRFEFVNMVRPLTIPDQKSLAGRRSPLATTNLLPLGELEAFSRSRLSVLLSLLHARVAREEAFLL